MNEIKKKIELAALFSGWKPLIGRRPPLQAAAQLCRSPRFSFSSQWMGRLHGGTSGFNGGTSGFNGEKVAPNQPSTDVNEIHRETFLFCFFIRNLIIYRRWKNRHGSLMLGFSAKVKSLIPSHWSNNFLEKELISFFSLLWPLHMSQLAARSWRVKQVNTWSISCLVSSNEGCCQPNDDRTSN